MKRQTTKVNDLTVCPHEIQPVFYGVIFLPADQFHEINTAMIEVIDRTRSSEIFPNL